MSGFCVYGVSMQDCIKRARKSVKNYVLNDDKKRVELTTDEWNVLVQAEAVRLFEVARPKQISLAFDSPQFCHDWISIGNKTAQIRSPKVMAKGKKVDAKGVELVRKGSPVIGWVPYAARAA